MEFYWIFTLLIAMWPWKNLANDPSYIYLENELAIITTHENMMEIKWENICKCMERYLLYHKPYISNSFHFHSFEATKLKITTNLNIQPYISASYCIGTIDYWDQWVNFICCNFTLNDKFNSKSHSES